MFCRGSASFAVQERGSLALTNIALDPSATIDLSGGGSLSLASMAVPAAALGAAQGTLSGAGSTLRLDAVTVPEVPDAGALTGTISLTGGLPSTEPASLFDNVPGWFIVSSGPCAVSEGGRCVGRPEGYGPSEDCAITVGGGGGVLGPCPVFDMDNGGDSVTLPGGAAHYLSDCPEGAALVPSDAIAWHSDGSGQGSASNNPNGCVAKGLCGLPYSGGGLGGGWQLCFA